MTRSGRINLDSDDTKFNKLRQTQTYKTIPLFDNINNYIKNTYPLLKRATGSWYINYCIDKTVIFFKVDTKPTENCIYISVCNEDYPKLSPEVKDRVQPKPINDPLKPGNFLYQAKILHMNDMYWVYKLLTEIYIMVMKRYRY